MINVENGSKQLSSAAFAGLPVRSYTQCSKGLSIGFADWLTIHRIEVLVNRFDKFELFRCRQIQKSMENDRHILVHATDYKRRIKCRIFESPLIRVRHIPLHIVKSRV